MNLAVCSSSLNGNDNQSKSIKLPTLTPRESTNDGLVEHQFDQPTLSLNMVACWVLYTALNKENMIPMHPPLI